MDDLAATPTWTAFVEGWELFRDPVLCALVAGAALGYLGVHVVLRRMVFVSAAVTQSAGLGVALAFFAEIHLGLQVDPLVGAAGLAVLATVLLSLDPQRFRLPRDVVMGLVFAVAGGGAVLVGDRISQEAHDIQSILFGSAVVVSAADLRAVTVLSILAVAVAVIWSRALAFSGFDPEAARVQGVPARFLNGFLFVAIGLVVGVSARALGALPVFGFSVLPAASVLMLGVTLPWAFPLSAALGALCGGFGYVLAFFYEFPVGGTQTVLASSVFVLSVGVRRFFPRLTRRVAS